MSSAITGVVTEQLVSKALDEAMARIAKKLAKGKRLTDAKISML
jgi:hypothetical protein